MGSSWSYFKTKMLSAGVGFCKSIWKPLCQTTEQHSIFKNKKKRKVNRQMAGECQLNKQSGSWVIFFVFFFICLDGFLLCDSFCFQFSLHTGEQRKITGEVSFYICAVRDGFMKMFLGESRKRHYTEERRWASQKGRLTEMGESEGMRWKNIKLSREKCTGDMGNRRYWIYKNWVIGREQTFFWIRLNFITYSWCRDTGQVLHTVNI